MSFFKKRKLRKQVKSILHSAKNLRSSRFDLFNSGELEYLDSFMQKAREACHSGDVETLKEAGNALEQCLHKLDPPKKFAVLRENFDVLVVAFSVAMAFRAYFYQPFKIPTGSMQPTLYGIHSVACNPADATVLDRQPFKFAKWLITGKSLHIIRAKSSGTVSFMSGETSRKPGYVPVVVAGVPYYVPSDAVELDQYRRPVRLVNGVHNGAVVRAGDLLWAGVVISGDFVFVNRWLWNFRHPRRGEVMVFSTNGIKALQQGTHYIKRMTGLPGETLEIHAPNLVIDGKVVLEPERIRQIAGKEAAAPGGGVYTGFNPSGTRQMFLPGKSIAEARDKVVLGSDEYYAMGDNSFNSFDSRYWGTVPECNLLGPATVVYWPFTSPRAGFIR